jgi:two-component sensor histidine kinase
MAVDTSVYSLYELAQNAMGQVSYLSQDKEISVYNRIKEDIYVHADKNIIIRTFINLLTNAIKYTHQNGRITITASRDDKKDEDNNGGMIKITVADTGKGIPPDQLNKVFDKFAQVQAKNSGEARSTGLGLTFCKMAVDAHGGKIGVESEVGKGSVFWFKLPAAQTEKIAESSGEVSSDENSLDLDESDKELLRPYAVKLKALWLNETTEILKILGQIENNSEAIKNWKKEVEDCLFSLDEDKYYKLIRID